MGKKFFLDFFGGISIDDIDPNDLGDLINLKIFLATTAGTPDILVKYAKVASYQEPEITPQDILDMCQALLEEYQPYIDSLMERNIR